MEADPEEEMMNLQFAFMVQTTPEPVKYEVSEFGCSQSCIKIVKFLRDQIEIIKRENEDLKYEGYTLRKNQKPLKTQLENKTKDFKKLQEDYSNKCENYDHLKRKLAAVTMELDTLKNCFEKAEFNFKKYDVSSEKITKLIEGQSHWRDITHGNQIKVGLGFESVPPPFNHNYTAIPCLKKKLTENLAWCMESQLLSRKYSLVTRLCILTFLLQVQIYQ